MQKLDPKAVWLFFFSFSLSGLIVFILSSFWLGSFLVQVGMVSYLWGPLLVFILFVIFCWIWAKLTYRFWGYQLTENAFKKERGVIWKKYVSIPYERIQNVDIYRGVFARILGLSDLQIQTAGASAVVYGRKMAGVGAEGRLPGLDKQVAEQLREELIRRAKGVKQGL